MGFLQSCFDPVVLGVVHHNLTHKFAKPNCRLDRPVNGADMIQQSLEFPVTFESAQQKRRPHTRITPDGLDGRPATRHSRNAPPLPCRRKHLNELHLFQIPRNLTISCPSPQSLFAPFLVRYRTSTGYRSRAVAKSGYQGWTIIGDKGLRY